jgi:hypothetical protein
MKKRKFKSDINALMSSVLTPGQVAEVNSEVKKAVLEIKLADLRKAMSVTQYHVEGFSQPSVASLEKRTDMKLSTLMNYLHAIGLGVEIKVFPRRKRGTVPDEVVLLRA